MSISPKCRPPKALYLFVAIDRTSKFAYAELHEKAGKMIAAQFLRSLINTVPYTIHTILTDNGIQFTNRKQDRHAFEHIFEPRLRENGIEHRLTKVKHPWTNGQVERMNRTIKEAIVKRFHYDDHEQLRSHLGNFVLAYNFGPSIEDPQGTHALRIYLQMLDIRTQTIHPRPNPANAGTKHLGRSRRAGIQEAGSVCEARKAVR